LPVYAHNDYENRRPLHEALERGLRGVEVDLFLVDGVLRVGHDRGKARRGATLETLYLAPLDSLVAICNALTVDSRPFLLAIELKQSSAAAYDSLGRLIRRHRRLFAPRSGGVGPAVEIVLVGWHPRVAPAAPASDTSLPIQFRLTSRKPETVPHRSGRVRMISIDYGKSIGPWWSIARIRREWLATLRRVKAESPGRLLRVHNLPPDAALHAVLLDTGVDLIGVRDLAGADTFFGRTPGFGKSSGHN